ncbi:MAG: zinc-binding dehydrogenase [Chloroflexaceae bacterium]|nr:zinc-binding dehydrogenase [Chloroflexaceae bacterium]
MPITSRAVVIPRRNAIELGTVQVTEPKEDGVLIRTAFTSISAGTERMLLDGRMPHPALSFPLVPGYETVGRVVRLGKKTPEHLKLNQLVYVGGARCFKGVNPAWGGQSEYICADAEKVVPLDGISPDEGVLLALGATAMHGVRVAQVARGDQVLVLGQGIVGQLAARIARQEGAARVVVLDRLAARLALSEADQVIDVTRTTVEEAMEGEKVDVIIEATGSMAALTNALPLLADHGRVLLLGYYDHVDLPYAPLFLREARIMVAREWESGLDGDLPRTRDLIASGQLKVSNLLTHRVPLDKIQAAYRLALEDPSCLKVVVEWPQDGME